MNPKDRLIVALDVDSEKKAVSLVERLKSDVRFFKVGFELFTSCGPEIIEKIKNADSEIFLDLKFHDIPNTVAKAAITAARFGVFMFNVHSLGGYDMMKEAADAARKEVSSSGIRAPKILAVTILTSIDEKSLKKIGINDSIQNLALRLACLAKDAGLDGVVASPQEAKAIRKELGKDFLIVTPGIRPAWAAAGDQKRVATPKSAVDAGADFIVVGRPIIEAKDPASAAQDILKELET